jgi:hypothetical protein
VRTRLAAQPLGKIQRIIDADIDHWAATAPPTFVVRYLALGRA